MILYHKSLNIIIIYDNNYFNNTESKVKIKYKQYIYFNL